MNQVQAMGKFSIPTTNRLKKQHKKYVSLNNFQKNEFCEWSMYIDGKCLIFETDSVNWNWNAFSAQVYKKPKNENTISLYWINWLYGVYFKKKHKDEIEKN